MSSLNSVELLSIIPKPLKVHLGQGNFILNNNTIILFDSNLDSVAKYFKNQIFLAMKWDLALKPLIKDSNSLNTITLKISSESDNLGEEGYYLMITQDNIAISANSSNGIFYGIQTLRQLLPIECDKVNEKVDMDCPVPCLIIEDFPRFSWRGYMLDEARHFLGKSVVKKVLDIMALLKLNIFHWHLTDDQGWRIEIKRYPRLTEIGSKRRATQLLKLRDLIRKKRDEYPHQGYYTQEDIKEIIAYAAERFIKIIPEIEMPGHCMAALASYPDLSCTEGSFQVPITFGIKKDVCCPGKELVFEFLQNVLDEVMALFPSDIIHIGGDEVPTNRWKKCSHCQSRIKNENLKNEKELQTFFCNRIALYLSDNGHKAMGWNEILNNKLDMNVICQYWLPHKKEVIEHIKSGRKTVISHFFHTYLDYSYYLTPLRKVYRFEPIPRKIEKKYYKNVLGLEAPL